jgi:hypothetical protein
MKDLNYVEPKKIEVELGGKTYSAQYFVKDNLIRVMSYEFGTTTTQLEGGEEEETAKTMFTEQIKKSLNK